MSFCGEETPESSDGHGTGLGYRNGVVEVAVIMAMGGVRENVPGGAPRGRDTRSIVGRVMGS